VVRSPVMHPEDVGSTPGSVTLPPPGLGLGLGGVNPSHLLHTYTEIHIYIYTYIYIHIYICLDPTPAGHSARAGRLELVQIYFSLHTCIYTYYTYIHTHRYIDLSTYVCMYVCMGLTPTPSFNTAGAPLRSQTAKRVSDQKGRRAVGRF